MLNLILPIRPACKRTDVFLLLHKNSYFLTLFLDTIQTKSLLISKNLSMTFRQAFYSEKLKGFPGHILTLSKIVHVTSVWTNASAATFTASSLAFNPLLLASQPHLYFGNSLSCSSYSISFLISTTANLSSSHAPLVPRLALLYIAASLSRLTDFPAHIQVINSTILPALEAFQYPNIFSWPSIAFISYLYLSFSPPIALQPFL